MGERPDDVPALEDLEDGAPLPDYWSENTTITTSRYTKARLNQYRDDRPWDVFLEELRAEHADPLTLSDADAIAEQLESVIDEVSMAGDPAVDVDAVGMVEELENVQSAVATIEERTGRLERMLEDMGGRR